MSIYYADITVTNIKPYAKVWYSKTCLIHKRNLKIDWNFGTNLILYISTELRHKNSMLGSQDGLLPEGESGKTFLGGQSFQKVISFDHFVHIGPTTKYPISMV